MEIEYINNSENDDKDSVDDKITVNKKNKKNGKFI